MGYRELLKINPGNSKYLLDLIDVNVRA